MTQHAEPSCKECGGKGWVTNFNMRPQCGGCLDIRDRRAFQSRMHPAPVKHVPKLRRLGDTMRRPQ